MIISRPADPVGAPKTENTPRAIIWMLVTTFFFVAIDVQGKELLQRYDVTQVVAVRFAVHALFAALVVGIVSPWAVVTRSPRSQIMRSLSLLVTTSLFFMAVRTVPLAEASAIMFLGPILITALSYPLLGEKVGPRRWAGVGFGFLGALLIIRPGTGFLAGGALLLLGAALGNAFYQIVTRRLAKRDHPLTTALYTPLVGALVTGLAAPAAWISPNAGDWALMVGMGLAGGIGHLCLIRAISLAPVAVVSPFGYTSLLWASLFGYSFFGDVPDAWTLAGAAVIAMSGLYILYREQVRGVSVR